MLSLFASLTLAISVADFQDDATKQTAAKADDAKQELVALTSALAKAESYTFTVQNDGGGFGGSRGGFGGGRGGRGGDAGGGEEANEPPPPPPPTKGTYKKGLPLHLTQGEAVAYKDGEQLVHKNAEGKWVLLDMQAARGQGRGGRGGGRGGGQGGGQGGDRATIEASRALFGLRSVNAPHASLADFGDKVDSISKSDKEGTVTYTGNLTEAAATELATAGRGGFGGGRGGGRGGGGGGQGPAFEYDGTYTIVVTKGAISAVTFEVTMSGSFGDRDFERTTKNQMTFAEIGKAKLEIPDAALAQFEI